MHWQKKSMQLFSISLKKKQDVVTRWNWTSYMLRFISKEKWYLLLRVTTSDKVHKISQDSKNQIIFNWNNISWGNNITYPKYLLSFCSRLK